MKRTLFGMFFPAGRALPRYLSALALTGLTSGALALASGKPAPFPQNIGERLAYRFSTTTQTPQGPLQQSGTLVVSLLADGTYVIVNGSDDGADTDSEAKLQRDGTLAISHLKSEHPTTPFGLQRLNQIAQIVTGYRSDLKPGDTWKSAVDLPLPGGQTASTPVVVTVTAVNGDEIDLSAKGHGTAPLQLPEGQTAPVQSGPSGDGILYSDIGPQAPTDSIPVDLTVSATATFVGGKLQAAKGSLAASIEAMHRKISSDWTISSR